MFDEAAHSRLRDTPTTKELHGVPRRILRAPSAVHLQESDLARELRRLLLVRHIAHLVRDVLEPRLHGFCARDHLRQFRADDRLRAERLPERLALRDPLQTFLDNHALSASGCANHDPTLVVEVA